jgi:hypothetical protein
MMSAPLVLALLWMVVANVLALLPSRDGHWTQAAVLTTVGVPLLGWLTWVEGPILGGLALLAGASILRWPLILLWRRLRGRDMGPAE